MDPTMILGDLLKNSPYDRTNPLPSNFFELNSLLQQPLLNLSNTCFVNVILQALFHTKPLVSIILEDAYEPDINNHIKDDRILVFLYFVKMIQSIYLKENPGSISEKKTPMKPGLFIDELRKYLPSYERGRQYDSQEFLIWLLNVFHDSLDKVVIHKIDGEPSNKLDLMRVESTLQWARHYRKKTNDTNPDPQNDKFMSNYSHILRIFGGQFLERINCEGCNHINYKYESFLSSELTIPKARSTAQLREAQLREAQLPEQRGSSVSIEDLLTHQCSLERLDQENGWTCDKCNVKNQSFRRMSYWQLPEILILTLKRFSYERHGSNYYQTKIQDYVSYDPFRELDMEPYLSNGLSETKYRLYAIICHNGSLDHGHYYAYCRILNSKMGMNNWVRYNDEHVSLLPTSRISDLINEDAYILMYQRIDTI